MCNSKIANTVANPAQPRILTVDLAFEGTFSVYTFFSLLQ